MTFYNIPPLDNGGSGDLPALDEGYVWIGDENDEAVAYPRSQVFYKYSSTFDAGDSDSVTTSEAIWVCREVIVAVLALATDQVNNYKLVVSNPSNSVAVINMKYTYFEEHSYTTIDDLSASIDGNNRLVISCSSSGIGQNLLLRVGGHVLA